MEQEGNKLENWEIEKMCRESDEDGCLIIVMVAVFVMGFALGFFMKAWLFS